VFNGFVLITPLLGFLDEDFLEEFIRPRGKRSRTQVDSLVDQLGKIFLVLIKQKLGLISRLPDP
jgi:hypothetical protein